ncbi:MAG: hypothetical protein ACYCPP_06485 [Nitrososphaerales archaeon]
MSTLPGSLDGVSPARRGIKTDSLFRILLNNPEGNLTKYRISVLAKTEQIQVSLLLRQLEAKRLVRDTRVTDYRGLIMEWAKREVKFPTQRYMLKGIMDVLRNSMKYALTTYQAETLVNGYLFPTKTDLYIHQYEFDQWHNALVKSGAMVGGGNVTLRLYDDGVFYNSFTTKEGYSIVSIPQLIVDLVREGGVAMQAAEMLIEKQK